MLTDNIDEGLVLLGKLMDWDPIDLTYASLLEARNGGTRWDDKPVTKAPRPKDLHSAVSLTDYICVVVPCLFVISVCSCACLLRDGWRGVDDGRCMPCLLERFFVFREGVSCRKAVVVGGGGGELRVPVRQGEGGDGIVRDSTLAFKLVVADNASRAPFRYTKYVSYMCSSTFPTPCRERPRALERS